VQPQAGSGIAVCDSHTPHRIHARQRPRVIYNGVLMRKIRRNHYDPKVEMAAMIDVIFLLLTFFVYCMVMMVNAQVLPVNLTGIGAGQRAPSGKIEAITIDKDGNLYWNRNAMEWASLDDKLKGLLADPAKPKLFLAMEAQGNKDRGPLLLSMIERLNAAGVKDFVVVGQPTQGN
jgi:biopolymer transport protein ExbD